MMINLMTRLSFMLIFVALLCSGFTVTSKVNSVRVTHYAIVGAEQMESYLPRLEHKKVALLINQTSVAYGKLLLDTLMSRGVSVVKIFVPEHGFRGTADAGAHIKNEKDAKTGLPIISLYGKNKKPTPEQMKDIDVLVYDLQDVGVRFYTYISTLEYAMDACIENDKELLILDRPNPNCLRVDGPVLDTALRSFVGMQPVPVLYGMTVGEYATMLVGEGWIKNASSLRFTIIPCKDYHPSLGHRGRQSSEIDYVDYELPIAPSPNLKTMSAINSYPSLCFFEGTIVSVGRGTDRPFEQWGHPDYKGKLKHSFIPKSTIGATKPLLEDKVCYGENLIGMVWRVKDKLNINYLLKAYQLSPQKDKFFNPFFEKLAGTKLLRQQIIEGKSEVEIRASWQPGLEKFKAIRKKYLLYED
jgi:uncharacterized protein YbbC (DUF1343 family)